MLNQQRCVLLFPVSFKSTLNELADLSDDALVANLNCNNSLYNAIITRAFVCLFLWLFNDSVETALAM
jgi:hypothetical protein